MSKKVSEHTEQSRFFAILRRVKHPVAPYAFAIPNGFLDTKSKRIRAWKEGMVSGVCDTFIPFPSKGFHGLFIEFKAKGGTLSLPQEAFINYARSTGYKAEVVFSLREALSVLKDYLEPPEAS